MVFKEHTTKSLPMNTTSDMRQEKAHFSGTWYYLAAVVYRGGLKCGAVQLWGCCQVFS